MKKINIFIFLILILTPIFYFLLQSKKTKKQRRTPQVFTQTIEKEKIFFDSDRDGDAEIYMMDPDGSNVQQLTFNDVADTEARVSPNGDKIIFSREEDEGDWDLWIMDVDGSSQQKLVDASLSYYILSSFSPDGNRIVYGAFFEELFIVNSDGSNNHLLIEEHDPLSSFWAENGKIYYSGRFGADRNIRSINPDGTGDQQVGGTTNDDDSPLICDSYVFFTCYTDVENGKEICRMDKDGSNLTQLTTNSALDWVASGCSPDKTQILFFSKRDGNNEVYKMDLDGSSQTRLTNNSAEDFANDWGMIKVEIPDPTEEPDPEYCCNDLTDILYQDSENNCQTDGSQYQDGVRYLCIDETSFCQGNGCQPEKGENCCNCETDCGSCSAPTCIPEGGVGYWE